MGGEVQSIGAHVSWAEARSALAWWIDAGVDATVQEEPRDWLKPVARKPHAQPADEPPPPNVARPTAETLSDLQQWLAGSMELPLASATARRVMPIGPQDAAIMLLTDAPTLDDLAAGQPIGGDPWSLTERMLAAIKMSADDAYVASLSCIHAPGARMTPAEREACVEIARRHVELARPKRMLLLGDGAAQALLGKPVAQARGHVHKIEGVRTVATFHPRHLIKRPLDKSLAWKDLLLLMEDES